ncbi:MAG: peroxiredoxin [Patescibacteria group bacterium]
MKKIILGLVMATILVSCTATQSPTKTTSNPQSSSLAESATGGLKVDLSKSYHYLDSEKKSYAENTFGDLISKTPYTIVYFYPKDGTPNCTIQALDFSRLQTEFAKEGYQILGVSKDDLASHKAFADRNELKIKLLQDKNSELLAQFGALGKLQEYGNGSDKSDIIRSTFIIDKSGVVQYAFLDVKAIGHADRILELIRSEKK